MNVFVLNGTKPIELSPGFTMAFWAGISLMIKFHLTAVLFAAPANSAERESCKTAKEIGLKHNH